MDRPFDRGLWISRYVARDPVARLTASKRPFYRIRARLSFAAKRLYRTAQESVGFETERSVVCGSNLKKGWPFGQTPMISLRG